MNLSHRLLSSVLLAGAVFSITALPLATLGSKPVTIQLEERPVFVGQLRELAGPYLALATGISLGVGVVSLAVSSWRHTTYKLEKNEAEIAALKQQLSEKQILVERLRFTDTKLQSSGLEQFLQREELLALRSASPSASSLVAPHRSASPQQVQAELHRPAISQPASQPTIPQTIPDSHRPAVPYSRFSTAGLEFFLDDESETPQPSETAGAQSVLPIAPEPIPSTNSDQLDSNRLNAGRFIGTLITEPVKIQPAKIQAMSSLPAAQSFKGFVRSDLMAEPISRSHINNASEQSTQLNELLGHLKQVMTQIEHLQTSQSRVPGNPKGS